MHKNFSEMIDFMLSGIASEFSAPSGWKHERKMEMLNELDDIPKSGRTALNLAASLKFTWPTILKIIIEIGNEEGFEFDKVNLQLITEAA